MKYKPLLNAMVSSSINGLIAPCTALALLREYLEINSSPVGVVTLRSLLFPYAAIFVGLAFFTMLMVKHGDNKVEAKKGLEALNIDD